LELELVSLGIYILSQRVCVDLKFWLRTDYQKYLINKSFESILGKRISYFDLEISILQQLICLTLDGAKQLSF